MKMSSPSSSSASLISDNNEFNADDNVPLTLPTAVTCVRKPRVVRFKDPDKTVAKTKKQIKSTNSKIKRKRTRISEQDSFLWYTRREIIGHHKSIILASRKFEQRTKEFSSAAATASSLSSPFSMEYQRRKSAGAAVLSLLTSSPKVDDEEDTHTLNWFLSSNMNQRNSKRKQMVDTIKAVKEFESATKTKCPEMLAQLLDRHSQQSIDEGNRVGTARAVTAVVEKLKSTVKADAEALKSPANCFKSSSSSSLSVSSVLSHSLSNIDFSPQKQQHQERPLIYCHNPAA